METLEPVVDDLTTVPEKYQSLYIEKDSKYVIDVTVKGMKPEIEVTRVHEALRKERTDHGTTKTKLKPFETLGDLETVQAQLARIPELEIAAEGKIDEKKIDKLVETRINQRLAPVQRERDTFKTQFEESQKTIDSFKTQDKTRKIHDAVRAQASKVKLRGEALEDALMLAERHLEVRDDDSAVVVRDGVGVTAGVDPATWMTEMQTKRPHWFGESVGGGAGGNSGNVSGTQNPFSNETWNLTAQGKIYNENPQRAENLARAAGTTIGGGKPAPKRK